MTKLGEFIPPDCLEISQNRESIRHRIQDYLPPPDVLSIHPTDLDLKRKDEYLCTRPGDTFSLNLYEGRLVIVPSWHPLNSTSMTANSSQYGTGSMETLTVEPVISQSSNADVQKVIGANIVLLCPRMNRLFNRALPAREIQFPISRDMYAQGIADLMAILGKDILQDPHGVIGRGSIRVSVGPGIGKFGKSVKGNAIDASAEAYYMTPYFPEKAYTGSGLVIAAGPNQRFQEFHGKHASQYGEAVLIGAKAKSIGADDALLFAPFQAKNPAQVEYLPAYRNDRGALVGSMLRLALANGLGSEIMAIQKDGTILLPPMNVNRLGGRTADYIMNYMAPAMGMKTEEKLFSLEQVLRGDIVGLFFAGNAVRVSAIGEIRLQDFDGKILSDIDIPIPQVVYNLIRQYEQEVAGIAVPSHPSLLTEVDLEGGIQARSALEHAFNLWL